MRRSQSWVRPMVSAGPAPGGKYSGCGGPAGAGAASAGRGGGKPGGHAPGTGMTPGPARPTGTWGPWLPRVPLAAGSAPSARCHPRAGREVGEQAGQLAAVPGAQGVLHADHEGLVRQAPVDEFLPELTDRMVALRVRGAEILGRCGRVRRRPSHEWSIGIIGVPGKGKPRISAFTGPARPSGTRRSRHGLSAAYWAGSAAEVMAGAPTGAPSGLCSGKWQAAT